MFFLRITDDDSIVHGGQEWLNLIYRSSSFFTAWHVVSHGLGMEALSSSPCLHHAFSNSSSYRVIQSDSVRSGVCIGSFIILVVLGNFQGQRGEKLPYSAILQMACCSRCSAEDRVIWGSHMCAPQHPISQTLRSLPSLVDRLFQRVFTLSSEKPDSALPVVSPNQLLSSPFLTVLLTPQLLGREQLS